MPILTKESLVFLKCEHTGYIECYIAFYIWRLLPFILITIGIIGNILNVSILSRKQLRKKSTCIYLIFLAITDSTVLCFGPFVEILRNVFGIKVYTLTWASCILTEWVIYTAGMSSCWIIVLVTIERALVTLFPTTAKSKLTPRNALIASVSLLILNAFHNGHLIYGYTFTEVTVNVSETNVQVVKSCSLRSGEYTDFYNTTWRVMLFVTGSILPITLIVAGNAIVGISLLKRRQSLRRIQTEGSNSMTSQPSTRNGFNAGMFFILSGVFIATTVPYGAYFVLLEYNKEVDGHLLAKYQLASVLMKCLVWSNFSFNFLLYFMTGRLFKKEFKKLLESAQKALLRGNGRSSVHPTNDVMT